MKKAQAGFTLIELVMVIVILGVLAATALPKFVDLKSDAATAATKGVAGALASASSINYAAVQVGKGTAGLLSCASQAALVQGGVPANFSHSGTDATAAGATTTCTLTNSDGGTPATWTLIGS